MVENTAPMIVYRGGFTADLGSVEIGFDDFGMNLENMAVGWIDDDPQIVDVGRAKGFDAREARQALACGRLAQRRRFTRPAIDTGNRDAMRRISATIGD